MQENGLTDKLVSLALLGRTEDMVYAAQYLEKLPGNEQHAIILYHKACRSTQNYAHFSQLLISSLLLLGLY